MSERQVQANRMQVPPGKWDFRHLLVWLVGDGEDIVPLALRAGHPTAQLRACAPNPKPPHLWICFFS